QPPRRFPAGRVHAPLLTYPSRSHPPSDRKSMMTMTILPRRIRRLAGAATCATLLAAATVPLAAGSASAAPVGSSATTAAAPAAPSPLPDGAARHDAEELAFEGLDDVREDLWLPTVGAQGSQISWRIRSGGEHAALQDQDQDSGSGAIVQVRRPAAGTDDASQAITREFTATVQPMPSDPDQDEAYVWAFFTGEGVGGEKISLAASRGNDALDWNTLNDGEPLFTSEHGEEGLRDPFILRA